MKTCLSIVKSQEHAQSSDSLFTYAPMVNTVSLKSSILGFFVCVFVLVVIGNHLCIKTFASLSDRKTVLQDAMPLVGGVGDAG